MVSTTTEAEKHSQPSGPARALQVQGYLFFEGRGDEAIEFYGRALGAEVNMLTRFKDSPEPHDRGTQPACAGDKIMHASLRIGRTDVLLSDGRCSGQPDFKGFALTLIVPSAAEAERLFSALADGGQVQMPMAETFFSPRFGMVIDRFGVCWMVYVGE